jgi:hypothetical protein
MNSKQGYRKGKGDFLRPTAGAAALIVTTMGATLWAGSAMAVSDSGTPSASQPATASVSLVSLALCVGGVLVAMMAMVLTVDYGRRIARRRAGGRRGGTHAKASRPRAGGAVKPVTDSFPPGRPADTGGHWSTGDPGLDPPDLPQADAGPPESEDEYPSWPGPPGPYALHSDHPSWPGGPELVLPVRLRRDLRKP